MKRIYFTLVSLLMLNLSYAQNYMDAARFSIQNPSITARSLGTGSSLGAVGAEFSTLSNNPAGIGSYRHSELVITPGYHLFNTKSSFNDGAETKAKKTKLHFGNIGILFNTNHTGTWKSLNFGIGVNLLQKFDQRITYHGKSKTSIIQSFAEKANGKTSDEFDPYNEGLAWEAYAIYPITNQENKYGTDFDKIDEEQIDVKENIWNYGQIRELVFGFGGNYDGKLMIGGTLGVPFVTFKQIRQYKEEDIDDSIKFFNSLEFTDRLTTSGVGINGKFGIIYKPIQSIRIGLSMHTPTMLTLNDNYSRKLDYDYTTPDFNGTKTAEPDAGVFDYKLVTPWKVSANFGYVLKQVGIFSADIEWIDHTSSTFEYESKYIDSESNANISIQDNLQSTVNIRLGADVGTKDFRFRAGYGLIGSPFVNNDHNSHNVSAGIGIVQDKFYIDMGYRKTIGKQTYRPYNLSGSITPTVSLTESTDKLLVTIGFKF